MCSLLCLQSFVASRSAARVVLAALVVLSIVLAGCDGNGRDAAAVPARDRAFVLGSTSVNLPPPCAPARVSRRLVSFILAFNRGEGNVAAALFSGAGAFNAYGFSATADKPYLQGRDEIGSWIKERHERGEGWTLTFVHPPTGKAGLPTRTTYGVGVRVSSDGRSVLEDGAKAVIDCATGLIIEWIGPQAGPE